MYQGLGRRISLDLANEGYTFIEDDEEIDDIISFCKILIDEPPFYLLLKKEGEEIKEVWGTDGLNDDVFAFRLF